ncbi:hypothetical protein [Desulfobacca acetoxidans]|nr:hypothetical protein [Desulfobacterales bacterium]
MSDFDRFLQLFTDGVKDLAQKEFSEFVQAALDDGVSFMTKFKSDVEEWGMKLARGEMTANDVEWLMQGKKDLAEMNALKQAGLAQARIQEFVNGVLKIASESLMKVFLPS